MTRWCADYPISPIIAKDDNKKGKTGALNKAKMLLGCTLKYNGKRAIRGSKNSLLADPESFDLLIGQWLGVD